MRIIAGDKRGLKLATLEGEDTRPTLERVKEAIFSSIQFVLPGANVLDLYAGSGQMGLEALSRGAVKSTFVDQNPEAIVVVRENCQHTDLYKQSIVLTMNAQSFLAQCKQKFDVIFLDPPYRKQIFPALLQEVAKVAQDDANIFCETEPGVEFPNEIAGLVLKKQYRYGTVQVTRYIKQAD